MAAQSDPSALVQAAERDAALLRGSASDVQRVEAAHRLAAAAAGGGAAALAALLGAFAAGSHTPTVGVTRKYGPVRLALDLGDASRRAAKYGLSAAGPVATDAMAAALAAAVAAQAWGQVPDVAHVLGQCSGDQTAVAAPSLGCGHPEAVPGAQGKLCTTL
jgi:hypothetical protein